MSYKYIEAWAQKQPRRVLKGGVCKGPYIAVDGKRENIEKMNAGLSRFRVAILIASDRAFSGQRPDGTGPALKGHLQGLGYTVAFTEIVADEKDSISAVLRKWIGSENVQLILTSGGTGLSPRDVTPEATLHIIEKRVPGMEEAMRSASRLKTPHAVLSRAIAGIAGKTLIVNLPGSPAGALDNLKEIESALPHALALIIGENPDP